MPITGTFNGFNIVGMPAGPAPKAIEFTAQDIVAVSLSPFTGQAQVQDWQAAWLEASVTLPPMCNRTAQAWVAFFLQVRGQACTFQLGDPVATQPQGSAAGTPLVSGNGQTGYSLMTKGWTPGAQGVLLAGDWIQVGYRLYRTLDTVNADNNGLATLPIWPRLRESPADGQPLVLTQTKGLWRLSANGRKWSINEGHVYGFQFDIREAL